MCLMYVLSTYKYTVEPNVRPRCCQVVAILVGIIISFELVTKILYRCIQNTLYNYMYIYIYIYIYSVSIELFMCVCVKQVCITYTTIMLENNPENGTVPYDQKLSSSCFLTRMC